MLKPIALVVAGTVFTGILGDTAQTGSAQCTLTYEQLSGRRSYRLYPYTFSYGSRHDPYWSYNASYFPYNYQGDGSYYGLGYSGYSGTGAHGNYWYW